MDGQAIILEDYLEVRPEREGRSSVSRTGKFVIGPWYVLPDEFLVSGESLVRNLALGRQVATKFGGKPSTPVSCATCSVTTARCRKFLPASALLAASSGAE